MGAAEDRNERAREAVMIHMARHGEMMTYPEVMEATGYRRTRVEKLRIEGQIIGFQHVKGRTGSPVRFLKSSVEAYLLRSLHMGE